VIALESELLVSKLIASRDHHVMGTGRAVLDELQHRPSEPAEKHITLARPHLPGEDPTVIRRAPTRDIGAVEGKEIGCLRALGGGDAQGLARSHSKSPP